MTLGNYKPAIGLLGVIALVGACEPAGITEARNQLGRGGERSIILEMPLVDTVFKIETLLEDSEIDTTAEGLLVVEIDPESVSLGVGDELEFEGLNFDRYAFGYGQLLRTEEVSTSMALPSSGVGGPAGAPAVTTQIRFDTPEGSDVVGATIDTGTVVRNVVNGTICDATVTVELTDSTGAVVASFPPTLLPAGATVLDSIGVDTVSVGNYINVDTDADFGVCVPGVGSTLAADITLRPMTAISVDLENVNETFSESYDFLAGETGLGAVDTVVVGSGSFAVTVQNKLPIPLTFDVVLNGVLGVGGQPLTDTLVVAAAPGDGTTRSGVLSFPLAGATILPENALAVASGRATAASATITNAVVDSSVIVDGSGDLTVQSLSGRLDPDSTPELTVSVEEVEEIPEADLDLGDLEDVVDSSTLNDATISLTLANSADVQAALVNFNLGVVELDALGAVPRDGAGDPVFEVDSLGNPILIAIADPGDTTLTIARSSTKTVEIQSAPLVNRLVHILLGPNNDRAAVVAFGDVIVGDGTQARVTSSDSVSVEFNMAVGLDFSIPAGGVTFKHQTVMDGLKFSADEADQIIERLDSATITTEVVNRTPFGVAIDIAFVEGDLAAGVDVVNEPGAVVLSTITLDAPTVDAQGVVTTPTSATVRIELTPTQVRELLGDRVSATVNARLIPGTGSSGGRGALRAVDEIELDSRARVVFSAGGTGGSQ